jgi:hypothetical protein
MGLLDSLSSGPAVVNNVSAFVIEEVAQGGLAGIAALAAGAVGAALSSNGLELQGRGLPHRPLSLTTSQRLTMTWLPGYSVATAQALGAKEEITSIKGRWSDKYLAKDETGAADLGPLGNAFAAVDNAIGAAAAKIGLGSGALGGTANSEVPVKYKGQRIEKAYKAAEIVDNMVRSATFVEVRWDNHARRGFITKFAKDWHTALDLEWEMELTWVSRAEPNPPVTAQELSMGDTASLFQALSDALNLEALPPTFPMANDVLADLDAGIKRIASTTQAIADTVGNVTTLALVPFGVARAVMALCDTIRGQADALRNFLRAQSPADLRTNRAGSSGTIQAQMASRPAALSAAGSTGFADAMVCHEYVRRVDGVLKKIVAQAVIQKDEFARKVERTAAAVVTTREGDDLRTLASRYYGSPNNWKKIALANGLTSAGLVAGLSIVIPKNTDGEGC